MPVRLSAPLRLSARRAAPLALLLLPLLSGCGAPKRDQFPPVCPAAQLVPPTQEIALYRPGSNPDDLVNRLLSGRVVGIDGKCTQGDDQSKLGVVVTASFSFTRGPAMQGGSVTVPVFIAVAEGDTVLDKRVFGVVVEFPDNADQTTRKAPPVHMVLPVSATKSGAAYRIIAGFQLTPAQLSAAHPGQ